MLVTDGSPMPEKQPALSLEQAISDNEAINMSANFFTDIKITTKYNNTEQTGSGVAAKKKRLRTRRF